MLLRTFDVLFNMRVNPADMPASPPVKLPEASFRLGILPPEPPLVPDEGRDPPAIPPPIVLIRGYGMYQGGIEAVDDCEKVLMYDLSIPNATA